MGSNITPFAWDIIAPRTEELQAEKEERDTMVCSEYSPCNKFQTHEAPVSSTAILEIDLRGVILVRYDRWIVPVHGATVT